MTKLVTEEEVEEVEYSYSGENFEDNYWSEYYETKVVDEEEDDELVGSVQNPLQDEVVYHREAFSNLLIPYNEK
jgi:hypothetical protein